MFRFWWGPVSRAVVVREFLQVVDHPTASNPENKTKTIKKLERNISVLNSTLFMH